MNQIEYLNDADLNRWAILINNHRKCGKSAEGYAKNKCFRRAGQYVDLAMNRVKEIGGSFPEWLELIGLKDVREDGTTKSDVMGRAYVYRNIYLHWEDLKRVRLVDKDTGERIRLLDSPSQTERYLPKWGSGDISRIHPRYKVEEPEDLKNVSQSGYGHIERGSGEGKYLENLMRCMEKRGMLLVIELPGPSVIRVDTSLEDVNLYLEPKPFEVPEHYE